VASTILTLDDAGLEDWYDDYRFDVRPITDDAPYFWNFARLSDVVRDVGEPIDSFDPEAGTGERVLLLLLAIALLFAAVFLLLPFVAIRRDWKALPHKPISALYFASLGFGFLFFEITLIQRLTLFLGYPTYSLTVTLASILLFTGVGALLSGRVVGRGWSVGVWLLAALAVLTLFYELGLPALTDSLLGSSLAVRIEWRSWSWRRSGSASACSCRSGWGRSAGSAPSPGSTWPGGGRSTASRRWSGRS